MSRTPIPLHDRIIVERAPVRKMAGVIALPNVQYDDKTITGIVLAIGPEVVDVKLLDRIAFPRFCNAEIEVDGVKYLVLKECEVWAVVDDAECVEA